MRASTHILASVLFLGIAGCADTPEDEPAALDVERPGQPVAMLCEGTLESTEIGSDGELNYGEPFNLPSKEFFVFDTKRKTIYNGKVESGDWYNFCDLQEDCATAVSSSEVRGTMRDSQRVKTISINRQTGEVIYSVRVASEDGSVSASRSRYNCSPVDVPIRYREQVGPPLF